MQFKRLDWFAFSSLNPSLVGWLLDKLSWCKFEELGFSRFHTQGFKDVENGVHIRFSPKKGCKNHPVEVELTGKFFHSEVSELVVNEMIWKFQILPFRIDHRIDYVDEFIPIISGVDKKARNGLKCIMDSNMEVQTWFAGKSDFRVRLYDKMEEGKEFCNIKYPGAESVWRLEVQLRGKLLKRLLNSEMGIYELCWGYLARRYFVSGLETNLSVSGYEAKTVNLVRSAEYWDRKRKKAELRQLIAEREMDILIEQEEFDVDMLRIERWKKDITGYRKTLIEMAKLEMEKGLQLSLQGLREEI